MAQSAQQTRPGEKELRAYAAGETGWEVMRDQGFSFDQVLAGLGNLGLRMPSPDTPQSRQASDWLLKAILEDRARKEQAATL